MRHENTYMYYVVTLICYRYGAGNWKKEYILSNIFFLSKNVFIALFFAVIDKLKIVW